MVKRKVQRGVAGGGSNHRHQAQKETETHKEGKKKKPSLEGNTNDSKKKPLSPGKKIGHPKRLCLGQEVTESQSQKR